MITVGHRYGEWQQTYTGRKFWPLDPRAEDIHIEDIAAHLSKVCRYGGACKRYMSVAEHCVAVSNLVPIEYMLEGLLHDSAEAYVGDMVRPLKHSPEMMEFRSVEYGIERRVRKRFNLQESADCWQAVKEADDRILVDEINALMTKPDLYLPRLEQTRGYGVVPSCWGPAMAEAMFLERYDEIILNRGGHL